MIDFFCAETDKIIDFCTESNVENKKICVAVSGGSDSMSLLTLSTEWARRRNAKIFCVTVDHKLRKESASEAEFVGNFCGTIGVNHTVLEWNRENDHIDPGKLENLAREARYKLISDFCENHGIKFVFIGHTANDQLETFEMRKKFGSSDIGLACMSQVRSLTHSVKLLRPLLHFTKCNLEKFLKDRNIRWKTDPMNDQDFFLRVTCRKKIAGYSEKKFADISEQIKRLGKKRNAIETAAVYFLRNFCDFSSDTQITAEKIPFLSEEKNVQAEILKRIIWYAGKKKYATNITTDICNKILNKELNTLGRCLLKVKKDVISITKEKRKIYRSVDNFDNVNLFDVFI